jgi:hypothetical protein
LANEGDIASIRRPWGRILLGVLVESATVFQRHELDDVKIVTFIPFQTKAAAAIGRKGWFDLASRKLVRGMILGARLRPR